MDNNIKLTPPQDFKNAKYLILDYIQSTGTQYIDTGVKVDSSYYKFICTIAADAFSGNVFCGHHRGGGYRRAINLGSNNTEFYFAFDNTSFETNPKIADFNFHTAMAEYSNGAITYGFDGNYLTGAVSGIDTTLNEYLFCMCNAGSAEYFTKCRMSSFTMYSGSSTTLVRDFIPVVRLSDMAIGMYDKVNDKFYANAGSGTFGKGNIIGII